MRGLSARSTGANGFQSIRFGVIPQIFPVILSNALYFFESNTRSATILGIVGAGGIGLMLSDRIRINHWNEVCYLVIMIVITVFLIDLVSKKIRHHFIRSGAVPRPAAEPHGVFAALRRVFPRSPFGKRTRIS